jgi:hypothetical protein
MGDQDRVAAFLESLQQLPPYVGVTLRGCPAGASFAEVGQTTVTSGVVATTRNLEVATDNREVSSLYAILSRTGRDIAPFSAARHELEVVLLPGTALHLVESRELAGFVVHLVTEVDPDRVEAMPEDLLAQFAAEIERFLTARQTRPDESVTAIAGKFVGDLT